MSHIRDQGDGPQQDEYGNWVGQPKHNTENSDAFLAGDHGGQPQQRRPRPVVGPGYDPTQRRGSTTGEYGKAGVGLMDRAKEKLADIGGFKEDPGHVTTRGEPMESTKGL